jgi:hypothetical protein
MEEFGMGKLVEKIEGNIISKSLAKGEDIVIKSRNKFIVPGRLAALLYILVLAFFMIVRFKGLIDSPLDNSIDEFIDFELGLNPYSLSISFLFLLLVVPTTKFFQKMFRKIIVTSSAVLVYIVSEMKIERIYLDNVRQIEASQDFLGKLLGYSSIVIHHQRKDVIRYVINAEEIQIAINEQRKKYSETNRENNRVVKRDIFIICPFCKNRMRLEISVDEFKKMKCGRCNKTITTKNVIFEDN